jgi:hypothetical protein
MDYGHVYKYMPLLAAPLLLLLLAPGPQGAGAPVGIPDAWGRMGWAAWAWGCPIEVLVLVPGTLRKSLGTYLRALKPDCGAPGPIGNILATGMGLARGWGWHLAWGLVLGMGPVQKITRGGGRGQARSAGCYLLRWRWANNPLALPSKCPITADLSITDPIYCPT